MKHRLLGLSVVVMASLSAVQVNAQEWTGLYVGGHLGLSKVRDGGESLLFDTNKDGNYGDTVRTLTGANAFSPGFCDGASLGNNAGAGCESDDDKGTYGLRAGYDSIAVALPAFLFESIQRKPDAGFRFASGGCRHFRLRGWRGFLRARFGCGF